MAYYPLLRWVGQLVGVVFAIFATLVKASYYMDDRDSRISYGVSPASGRSWTILPNGAFDDGAKLYGGTVEQIDCFAIDKCTISIPFNGSGIALYVLLTYDITFNVTIDDGGTPTNHHFDGVRNCCNVTFPPVNNFEIYNVSSLSRDNHVLLVALLDNVGALDNRSIIYFDYAIVNNDTNVNPTSSINPSPSTNPPSKSASRSIIGPAVGGAIGGVAAISAIIFIIVWVRRRTRRGDTVAINPDLHQPMSNVEHAHIFGASQLPSSNDTPSNLAAVALPTPVIDWPSQSPLKHTASPDPDIPHSSPTILATSSLPTPQTGADTSPIIGAIPSPRDSTNTANRVLASEEVRFLRGLYSSDVPPDEIAGLIQVMRERREAASGVARPSGQAENAAPEDVPPVYDFAT